MADRNYIHFHDPRANNSPPCLVIVVIIFCPANIPPPPFEFDCTVEKII